MQTVIEQPIDDTIKVAGRVTFDDARLTHAFSPVSGRVMTIEARLGDRVKKGQVLATIMAPDIGTATSDLRKAAADEKAAKIDLARQRDLVTKGAASVRDREQAEATDRIAEAELSRAQERVELLRGGMRGVAQRYSLRAEIDGEVVARLVSPGIEVPGLYAGGSPTELFTIGNIDRVWVLADVFEMDLGRVHRYSPVTVRAVAYPEHSYRGQIDWISEVLDPTTRTARVKVVLDNDPRFRLRPEMFATAEITVDPVRALAVPVHGVIRLGETTFVFVERGQSRDGRHRFERIPVVLDPSVGVAIHPVVSGLSAGMRIVTNNAIQLTGMLR